MSGVYLKTDGTGRSILPAAGSHIVALMTRRGGQRVDGTALHVTTGQLGNMFSHTNVGLCISSANLKYDKQIMEQGNRKTRRQTNSRSIKSRTAQLAD